jgi:hypothetical protein
MILLDTNVLSALMLQAPDRSVVEWLDEQPRTSIWTTSITVFEIRFGLQVMATGRRRSVMLSAFEHLLAKMIERRIAAFDDAAAQHAADLMAVRQKKGRSGELRDTMIAGIALATHAAIATRNVKHFEDTSCLLINPWKR